MYPRHVVGYSHNRPEFAKDWTKPRSNHRLRRVVGTTSYTDTDGKVVSDEQFNKNFERLPLLEETNKEFVIRVLESRITSFTPNLDGSEIGWTHILLNRAPVTKGESSSFKLRIEITDPEPNDYGSWHYYGTWDYYPCKKEDDRLVKVIGG